MKTREVEAVARAVRDAYAIYLNYATEEFWGHWKQGCEDISRAAIAALDAHRGWRPIADAPKDETAVLIFSPGLNPPASHFVCEAWWCEEGAGWWQANTHPTDHHDGQVIFATHWMPLPEPPEET